MANLQYFKCKGSFGIHYGLGLDEVAVNFENISGLINLAGQNGTSKTTFMEMLSPFPVFPSRQQKNPQKYSFKKQFRLRDSYKEVCYLYQGKRYVFRVEIPAGTTMSPEGYISCDGVPMVKGKITEYKKVVSELFGSEKLFYSSIFSCQGGQKLTDLTVGDFKQLLIELLGLKRYVEYYKNTGDVITECKNALDSVLRELEIYSAREQEIEKNKQLLESERLGLESKQIEIAGLEDRI
jgi:exonuclease SbcC